MERNIFHQTNDDKAPERIWAWDDKTPTEREALVRLLQIVTRNGALDDGRTLHEVIADALLARGLRLQGGEETMARAAEILAENHRLKAERDQEREEHTDTLELLDQAHARAAAAAMEMRERAAQEAYQWATRWWDDVDAQELRQHIRDINPDASAVLSRMLDAAYAAGQERMQEAAVNTAVHGAYHRIRALPITPRPDRDGE